MGSIGLWVILFYQLLLITVHLVLGARFEADPKALPLRLDDIAKYVIVTVGEVFLQPLSDRLLGNLAYIRYCPAGS